MLVSGLPSRRSRSRRFSAAVSMAGYYVAEHGHFPRDLWGGSLAYRHANSLD
jgi:hypothetical protein